MQDGATPLHAAAVRGHAEVVKVLLAAGANVNTTTDVSEEGRELGYITETESLT
jgi:ankyrin repeat protein